MERNEDGSYKREPEPNEDLLPNSPEGALHVAHAQQWVPKTAIEALKLERDVRSSESEYDQAERILKEALPVAVAAAVHIALYSNNDNTRLKAAMYLIDRNMGKVGNDAGASAPTPWAEMLYDGVGMSDVVAVVDAATAPLEAPNAEATK